MKKVLSLVLALAMLPLAACTNTTKAEDINKVKPVTIVGEDYDKEAGADSYSNAGDNEKSIYYLNPDFYNMKSDDKVIIIPEFKTMQQTTEWSCGNAAALMVLNHFGKTSITEMDLALDMKSSTDLDILNGQPGSANNFFEYGTDVKRMYDYFSNLEEFNVVETSYKETYGDTDLISEEDGTSPVAMGNLKPTFSPMSLYASENDDNTDKFVEDAKDSYFVKWVTENIKAGRPIMVEWGDWDGHWQTIIGY